MFGKALMDVQRVGLLALLDRYIRDGTRRVNWLTRQDAVRSIQFILTHFVDDGRLSHSFKDGQAKLAGYLGDLAPISYRRKDGFFRSVTSWDTTRASLLLPHFYALESWL
jgi:hypothetical protein